MDQETKRKYLREAAEHLWLHSQVAQFPDVVTQEWAAENSSYERVRVTVEQLESGKATEVYTYTDDPDGLLLEIRKAAALPKDLQERIELGVGVGYDDQGDTVTVRGTMQQILDKQLMGGRPPDTDIPYGEIAERIRTEGTIEAYDREYKRWARDQGMDRPNLYPDAEETFYRAMNRYGIRKRELRK
jgi:hypothetical protein